MQKYQRNTFLHLHVSGRDVQAHMTSPLYVKKVYYDWTEEETEHYSQMMTERNNATVPDSVKQKQM